jgi:uncharacterized surface anchored protein
MKINFTKRIILFLFACVLGITNAKAQCVTATLVSHESRCVSTGQIDVTVTSGVGPFIYDFVAFPEDFIYSGPTNYPNLSGLPPGNYTIRVIDQNTAGCYTDYSTTVAGTYLQPNSFVINATNPTGCNYATNGSITSSLFSNEGRAPFTYTIIAGPSSLGVSNSTGYFNNLSAGTYTVKLSDSCGNDQVRSTTLSPFQWNLTASSVTKTACNSYSLTSVTIDNTVPGMVYSVKQGSTVLASGTTLPLTFTNPDATIGSVMVCATDPCGNGTCNNTYTLNDWSFSPSTSYVSCNTWTLNSVSINGTATAPLTYGWVRATNDTVWSSTIPFNVTKPSPLDYWWSTIVVKDGCGIIKSNGGPFMNFWVTENWFSYDNCTTSTIHLAGGYSSQAPITYEILTPTYMSNTTGSFPNMPDGYYTWKMTDACGEDYTGDITVTHDWQIVPNYQYYPCGLNTLGYAYTIPSNAANPITTQMMNADYSSSVYTNTYNNYYGYINYQEGLSPNTLYNLVVTDNCGRKDTFSFTTYAVGSEPMTHSAYVQPLCINKGTIYATAKSNHGGYHMTEFGLVGGPLMGSKNWWFYADNINHTVQFDDLDTGTYWVKHYTAYCTNEFYYDTVVIKPYKPTSLRKSLAINCLTSDTIVNIIAAAKGGIKPYTYEIIFTAPVNNPSPPQSSPIFTINGWCTLIRLKVTDSCGNSSLQDVSVRPIGPQSIRTFAPTTLCNSTNINLYVDSTIGAMTYVWKNPAGTIIGTNASYNLALPTSDTGIYTVRTVIPGTCYDTVSTINVRFKDLQCHATLGNYVWHDENQDGIQNNGEVGVAGVTVLLYNNANEIVGSTVTDAYGYYLFNNLGASTYHVGFTLPAGYVFTTPNQGASDELDSDVSPTNGLTGNYTLVYGDSNISVDAGIYYPIVPKASLGDRVWLDVDADGIQDPTEVGVSGVTVTLYDAAGNVVSTTVTDANGIYLFRDLTPATYSVGFTSPAGYVLSAPTQGSDQNLDSNPNVTTGKTAPVVLSSGENNLSLDAGIHAQTVGTASIGNQVWNDVNNNGIQDPNEGGIAGVLVTLYAADGTTVLATKTTDEFGNYIFNNLTPADYVVGFSNLPSGYNFSPQNAGANDAMDSDPNTGTGKTAVITLQAGEINLTVDAGLHNTVLPTAALGNYVWYDRNSNGIQDPSENGVPGVTATLYDVNNLPVGTTATDINGYYLFSNLAAGTYYVGFSNLPSNYVLTIDNATVDNMDSDPNAATGKTGAIALATGEINLTIDAGIKTSNVEQGLASLGDIVWNDLNNNGIQDAGENGVSGVTVTLYQSDATTVVATTETDALGNYIFTGLTPSNYVVGFSNLPVGYTFSAANQGTNDAIDADVDATTAGKTGIITLTEGENDLTVDAGIHTAPGLASLGNYVWNDLNQDGAQTLGEPGIPGVQVVLFDALTSLPLSVTTTDANGLYQFTGLNPGTYFVEFTNIPVGYIFTDKLQGGDSTMDSNADPFNGSTHNVTLVAGQNYPDLDAGIWTEKASLGNFVWNDTDGDGIQDPSETGVAGVTVSLYTSAGVLVTSTVTNATGAYNFVNLDPGTYYVGFSNIPSGTIFSPKDQGGFDPLDSDVDPATGLTSPITLIAGEYNPHIDAGIIFAQVGAGLGNYTWIDANADGIQQTSETSLPGVTVILYNATGIAIKSAITDQNGAYSFPDLVPGVYSVGFSTIPNIYSVYGNLMTSAFTTSNVGNDSLDSDANVSTGLTGNYTLAAGDYNPTVDAGIVFTPVETSVGNYVWYDANNNGIQDKLADGITNELPVSGVTMNLYNASNILIATTVTDATGYYLFSNLSPDTYYITSTGLPGYTFAPQNSGSNDSLDSDFNPTTFKTSNFILTAAQFDPRWDLGIVKTPTIFVSNTCQCIDALYTRGEVIEVSDVINVVSTPGAVWTIISQTGMEMIDNLNNDIPVPVGTTLTVDSLGYYSYKFKHNTGSVYTVTVSDGVQTLTITNVCALTELTTSVDNVYSVCGGLTSFTLNAILTKGGTSIPGTVSWSIINYTTNITTAITSFNPSSYSTTDSLVLKAEFTPTSSLECPVKYVYPITIDTNKATCYGSIGNYVWNDINGDGLNNEATTAGLNGQLVYLLKDNGAGLVIVDSTNTTNDVSGNPGFYIFERLITGSYQVQFPLAVNGKKLSVANQSTTIDNNNDALPATGKSGVVSIDAGLTGIAKDNMTIDAGYYNLASLGNYVWHDLNKDGLQNNSEVGVASVTVLLYNAANEIVGSTVTDAYGYYLFSNLNPGTYHAGFTLPAGYVFTTPNNPSDALDSDVIPTTGITGDYVLNYGDVNLTVDAGIYHPTPILASLGDRVWLDTDADGVQDATEVGVSGVTVTLYDAAGVPTGTTVTDANGNYQFSDLTPGVYSVGFTLPAGYVFSTPGQGGDPTLDSNPNVTTGKTSNITLAPGENNPTIDAGIHQQTTGTASLGNVVWNDLNNNGIQDPNEPGVSGVTVTLYAADGTTVIATAVTDEFGNYIFNNLTPADYIVGFSNLPAGFVFSPVDAGTNDGTDSDPNTTTGKTGIISLKAGEVNLTVDAGLYNPILPTAALGNYVWYDRNKDGIQDPTENGVPGVIAKLLDINNNVLAETTTDINGFYLFTNLAAGTYVVGFSNLPPNYILTSSNSTTDNLDSDPNTATFKTAPVTLADGEVNLTLDGGIINSNIETGLASLGDLVWNDINNNGIQDAGETGVAGITVTLYEANGTTVISTTTTDALGNYIFTGLNPGEYVVGFSNIPAGFTFSTANQGGNDALDADVDATTAGKTGVILLTEGENDLTVDAGIHEAPGLASLGNYVWIDLNQNGVQEAGEPSVAGVQATLYDAVTELPLRVTTTDANGLYQFTGLNPGSYYVTFSNLPAGYLFTSPNQGANEALDSDADPITGKASTVTLVAGENNPTIDAGIYTLKSSLGNYVWNDLDRDGVQDAGEPGISGVTVTLYDINGVPITSTVTDARGGYMFINLDPGTYAVGFTNLPSGTTFTGINQGGDDALDSDVDPITGLTPFVTLVAGEHNPTIDAGVLYSQIGAGLGNYVWIDANANGLQDPTEVSLPGVTVTLYNAAGVAIKSAVTDGNGAYSFPDLVPGTYSVGFSTIPNLYNQYGNVLVGYFTAYKVGTNDSINSDVNAATGKTENYTIVAGEYNPTIDAGIVFASPLPIKLVTFNATQIGCAVNVSWTTASEENIEKFVIVRDGIAIATVAPTNTNSTKTYTYLDANLEEGNHTYKLQTIEFGGKSEFSDVSNVSLNCNKNEIVVYPNPANSVLNINFGLSKVAEDVVIELRDVIGNVVYSQTINPSLINFITLDTKPYAAGQYILQIHNLESQTFVRKVQIVR